MKFYGNVNLQQNELQRAVIPVNEAFPLDPRVGEFAFVNSIFYICVSVANGLPVWVPMTREITTYTHIQDPAAELWTINHGLNTTSVQVQVFDTAGRMLLTDETTVVDSNTVTVEVNTPIAGRAVVTTGHQDGVVRPTYSYTHYQTTAATVWTIPHNLGYHPIVRVFVGNNEVQPNGIQHVSNNEVRVTFTTPYAGLAKLV